MNALQISYEESATKVSPESIDTLLGALDKAASTLENAQVSTLDGQDYTTEKMPAMDGSEDMETGFTDVPNLNPAGGQGSSGVPNGDSVDIEDSGEEVKERNLGGKLGKH